MDGVSRALDEPMADGMKARVAQMAVDPELVAVMTDPVIQQLLSECSTNSSAAATHLKNSGVAAAKVQKLVDSGMITIS